MCWGWGGGGKLTLLPVSLPLEAISFAMHNTAKIHPKCLIQVLYLV